MSAPALGHEVERLLLRPKEAFVAMGVSRSEGYKLLASGEWPKIRRGRAILIPVDGLRQWIEKQITEQQQQQGEV